MEKEIRDAAEKAIDYAMHNPEDPNVFETAMRLFDREYQLAKDTAAARAAKAEAKR